MSVRCPPCCSLVNHDHCLPSSLNLPALKYMPLNYTTSILSRLPSSTGPESRSLSPMSFIMLLFTCWVLSNFLRLHGLWHARLLCSPLCPWACSNSCSLSQWYYATISSSATSFSSCLQRFSASGSFPMSRLFPSGGQSIGGSASATILPKNIKSWFPLRLTSLISLQSKGLSRVFSSTAIQKHLSLLNGSTLNICTELLEKP